MKKKSKEKSVKKKVKDDKISYLGEKFQNNEQYDYTNCLRC